ncbi:putative Kinesin-like protein KIN-14J [Cocos nucifera]|uniref:Putative Kinesin-like protein KIN-14J n=1 Tax=Cocos nucifera TaxID=13894 RepID=A0A8K0I113_COCNU|nr:putative Kinesin-like protein KIN-14J [Cocos nucifera]
MPIISSPRQRLRLISSPAKLSSLSSAQQAVSKLCFSVQKRVMLGSPAQPKHDMLPGSQIFNQALQEKEIVRRLGTAQRVVCKNRTGGN